MTGWNAKKLESELCCLFSEYAESGSQEVLAAANEFGCNMVLQSVPLEAFGDLYQQATQSFYQAKESTDVSLQTFAVPQAFAPVISEILSAYGLAFSLQKDAGDRLLSDLHEREEQIRGTFKATPHGMAIIGLGGQFLEVNDVFCEILGYSTAELLKTNYQSITHPDDLEISNEKVDELLKGQLLSYQIEKRFIRKCGKTVWAQINVSLARDLNSKPLYLVTQFQDITDARKAEERIQQLNQKNALILNALGEGVYGVGLDGTCLFINPAALGILGYGATELLTDIPVHDLFHTKNRVGDDQQDPSACTVCAAPVEAIETQRGTTTFRRKDGSEFPVKFISTSLVEGNDIVGNVVVFNDDSVRLQAEDSLRASEARFRTLYNSTPSMLLSMSPAGTILEASDLWLETMEFTRDQITGKNFRTFLSANSRDQITDFFEEVRNDGRTFSDTLNFVTRSGAEIKTETSAISETNSAGDVDHILVVSVDVTEKRKTEFQLCQSQKMEAVGQLTGGIAHDFSNILQVIIGNLQVLERRSAEMPEFLDKLARAIGAADRAQDLTRRLLAFSRRQVLETATTNLNEVLLDLETLLVRSLRDDIELRWHLTPQFWFCATDVAQFENAILNLCLNSRHAMPDGGLLSISTGNTTVGEDSMLCDGVIKPGEYVTVVVADTGYGIAESALPHVLEPFFTTKDKGEGTGLGLSMVYGFVRQSGGYIDIRSELGEGTRVTLYFPKALAEEKTRQRVIESATLPDMDPTSRTIIAVEDDPDVREIVMSVLSEHGYKVLGFDGPEDALRRLDQDLKVDLLLTDVIMPGDCKGPDLADKMKARDPDLKVLFMSGYADNAFKGKRRLERGEKFLPKPATEVELLSAVQNLLNNDHNTKGIN